MIKDVLRQSITGSATIITILCNLFSGRITGRTVGEIAHRYPLALTPADYTFAIWGIIYFGLMVFAIYQALPGQSNNPRLRRIGYWYVLSCSANICWEFAWLNEQIPLSLLAMMILLLALLILYIRADINRGHVSRPEGWCVNVPFGIYLGWITLACILNVAVFLRNQRWDGWGLSPVIWTLFLLVLATGIALFIGMMRNDIAYLVTLAWAFIGILVKNQAQFSIVIVVILMLAILFGTAINVVFRRKKLRHIGTQVA